MKKITTYTFQLLFTLCLFLACTRESELSDDLLIESALSDAKANGLDVQYLVKSEFTTKDNYMLADGTIIRVMTGEELFIQNYSPALKVESISEKHVEFTFFSNTYSVPEPINRKISVADNIVSYEIH